MIEYQFGNWGIGLIWGIKGSVFPRALFWAVTCWLASVIAIKIASGLPDFDPTKHGAAFQIWASYTSVLGFLLVFRTQIAYSRFWEGVTTLQQVRGVWFNAVSNLIAFCNDSDDEAMRENVAGFQHLLIRLMSMMYCSALQQIADVKDDHFEVLDHAGIEENSLRYLAHATDRCEVIMQWIQRLIVININKSVVPIAPPIASRVFQELSNGIVDVQNARKIHEFPFPFPYAQMLSVGLLAHWMVTPLVAACIVPENLTYFGSCCFSITVWGLWGINYIAAEVENPFGDDANDLPVGDMQACFNRSLLTLLHPLVQVPPLFAFRELNIHVTEPEECLKVTKSRLTQLYGQPIDLSELGLLENDVKVRSASDSAKDTEHDRQAYLEFSRKRQSGAPKKKATGAAAKGGTGDGKKDPQKDKDRDKDNRPAQPAPTSVVEESPEAPGLEQSADSDFSGGAPRPASASQETRSSAASPSEARASYDEQGDSGQPPTNHRGGVLQGAGQRGSRLSRSQPPAGDGAMAASTTTDGGAKRAVRSTLNKTNSKKKPGAAE
eukprot:TRINITY_DN18012_c0_g1_i1.p1 TRINITY_DN18012_c0_g1~~TRINITY_DN18012_c0_g1_i1.p1  ORF type:complete len:551 (+),score=139.59 TRINITY_DN18012_c0_g1_i1:178-1830(+)